jgi:hypothetical protein
MSWFVNQNQELSLVGSLSHDQLSCHIDEDQKSYQHVESTP